MKRLFLCMLITAHLSSVAIPPGSPSLNGQAFLNFFLWLQKQTQKPVTPAPSEPPIQYHKSLRGKRYYYASSGREGLDGQTTTSENSDSDEA